MVIPQYIWTDSWILIYSWNFKHLKKIFKHLNKKFAPYKTLWVKDSNPNF
jgi:hypothetical protein